MDITCQPKPLGSGRWAALEIFTFPTLEQIEKIILKESLKKNGGNRSLTAEQLCLSRRTIQRKIQDYQLPF